MGDQFPRPFGKYTLLEPLAQGGMGSLYLAFQGEVGMEKLCVVKTVLRELADKEYVARFRDEAKVVVRLTHGNLVPVFDAGTDPRTGELYVAMEFIDGKDLRAVWNRCAKKAIAFPVDVAVHLVRELARGLHHAHTSGDLKLVHRDVSPPNVLLAFSGEVKLTDFGLAASTLKMERTAPGVVYGKVSYMSPEQARGEPLDGRTDLYAAGVILWELLTGRQLHPTSDGDALTKVRNPKVEPPSSRAQRVSPELDAIVMRALAPERVDRYPDCEAFRVALAEFLAREAPATDAARVAAFLRELFDDEIEADRKRRERLIQEARASTKVARPSPRPQPEPRPADDDLGDLDDDDFADRSAKIIGTLVDGRYQVIKLVGEGGMGRVYEAEHVEIGKRVAIKVLHPSYTRNPEAVHRFRREARAAARLGHPNIVDVTDSGTTVDGAVYFVMEYLEGCDLADVIKREKALGVERAVHIAVQVAQALDAAHAAGIIHRDLKPENIFLVARPGQPDFVKVLDFGIARQMEADTGRKGRLTNPGMAMGTPEYMAPEQAAGQPADARADVYAAGAILYEMLAGDPPHSGKNYLEVLNKKANETPEPLELLRPDVPPELSTLVATALARDPARRPQSMAALARALEKCRPDRRGRTGSRAVVEPTTGALIARARGRRNLRLALAGAASLVVIAGGFAAYRAGQRTEDKKLSTRVPPAPAPAPAPAPEAAHPAVAAPSPPKPPPPPPKPAPVEPRHARTAAPSPKRPAMTVAEAQRLLDAHSLDAAERAFQQLAEAGSPRGAVEAGLARVAYERGDAPKAVRLARDSLKHGAGWQGHLVLADAYFKIRKYDDAAQEYRAVLAAKPKHAAARIGLENAQRKATGG